jgi:hypothetical protein
MPDPAEEERRQRRSSRLGWPIRKHSLDSRESDDLSPFTTAEERLQMMWPLALEAWSLTGRPLPDHTRGDAPVRWFLRQAR